MDGRRGRPQSQTRCRGECKGVYATCAEKPYATLASRLPDTHLSGSVAHRTRCPPAPGGASAESPETGRRGRPNACVQQSGGRFRAAAEEGLQVPTAITRKFDSGSMF